MISRLLEGPLFDWETRKLKKKLIISYFERVNRLRTPHTGP